MNTTEIFESLESNIIAETIIEKTHTATGMLIIDIAGIDGDSPRGVIRCCVYDVIIEFNGWLQLIFRIEYLCNLFKRPMKTHEMRTLMPRDEEPSVFLSIEERIDAQKQNIVNQTNKIKSLQVRTAQESLDATARPFHTVTESSPTASAPSTSVKLDAGIGQQKRIDSFAIRIRYRQNSSWQGEFYCRKGKDIVYYRSVLELLHYMVEALDLNPLSIFE